MARMMMGERALGGARPNTLRTLGIAAAVMLCLAVLALSGRVGAEAALQPLTGRVVDNANLLSVASMSALASKLRALEDKSGIQLIVATVKSLGGEEIEPYANRLFRVSKIGDQKKNNGALLLIAPTEHKARIEVGYGLEGTLTDALSKLIITNALVPRFKTGDFQGGIEKGVDDIIAVLSSDQTEWQKRPDLQPPEDNSTLGFIVIAVIILLVLGFVWLVWRFGNRTGGMVFVPGTGSNWSSGSSSSSSASSGSSSPPDDNSYSGGGGSSGGGGASGSW